MIREMMLTDLDRVINIENKSINPPWKKTDYEYELRVNPYSRYYVLILNEEIIGYCGMWVMFDQAQITTFVIEKEHQRQGYSKYLMDKIISVANESKCENITLEVRVSNVAAISLYKKYGFIIANIRKSYYSDNHEDAYLMIKPLGGNYE